MIARTIGYLSALAVIAACAPAHATDLLTADELRAELAGKTITGYYLDNKVGFIEVYRIDGRISYKDDLKKDVGRWSIAGDMFCTFYETIDGACWHVRKVNANCLEFFPEDWGFADLSPEERRLARPHARAAREGEKITCDAWLGS